MQPTKSTTNDEKQKQNKKVRGLLAAALLVVVLVLPIVENSMLGYAAEEQVSAFQFRYPNNVTFEEINQQFADYPYDTSLRHEGIDHLVGNAIPSHTVGTGGARSRPRISTTGSAKIQRLYWMPKEKQTEMHWQAACPRKPWITL